MEEKEKGHERWMLTTESEGRMCVEKNANKRVVRVFDMQVVLSLLIL